MSSRTASQAVRTALMLLVAASALGWLPRLRRQGSIRAHVELLQKIAPVEGFAPVAAARAFLDLTSPFDLAVVAHRTAPSGPWQLVPVDHRRVAAWLA